MRRSDGAKHARLEVVSRYCDPGREYPPLLFIHGGWHGAWCWERGFLDRIASQGLEAHAMSIRGHGNSAGRERLRTTRVRDFVDDIEEVAGGLRSPPVIIGHSMGGFLAQKLMARRRFPGVVLLASAPPGGVARLVGKLILADPAGVLRANLTLRLDAVVSTRERVKRLFFSPAAPDAEVDFVASRVQDEAFLAYLDMLILDLCEPATGTPVLVMGAENDAVFSVETARRIASAYGAEAIIFPHMAHEMMLEAGWERVADTIVAWVRGGCAPRG